MATKHREVDLDEFTGDPVGGADQEPLNDHQRDLLDEIQARVKLAGGPKISDDDLESMSVRELLALIEPYNLRLDVRKTRKKNDKE